ncbi:YgaP family membrane protein [Metabacillus arenae]|uniref:DUF2892 domain-containing protein n=1 Tax=Metabacillus arenae TaxID=2771434 RepID=A0A926NR34_9BACI|nr:DUF2892 domain-containing protein [Metabacillus arenae]MBD1382371.1 DUF2892 domain-containing protein [Metabacillus arenae]
MVRPNIGIVNALIRITVGLTLVACAAAKYSRKPWRESLLLLMMAGAMKVGEGILRFCPITYLFEQYQQDQECCDFNDEDQAETYNPS